MLFLTTCVRIITETFKSLKQEDYPKCPESTNKQLDKVMPTRNRAKIMTKGCIGPVKLTSAKIQAYRSATVRTRSSWM